MRLTDEPEMWHKKVTERRKWERYPPIEGAVALLDGRTYSLVDISMGGLAISDFGGEAVTDEAIIGLQCLEEGFFIDAIRCRKISDRPIVSQSRYGEVVLNRISFQILEGDTELEQKLKSFMEMA
jgi:hypothetical protein